MLLIRNLLLHPLFYYDRTGLEPVTSGSRRRSNRLELTAVDIVNFCFSLCGAEGIRTLILYLAKVALSQLSYNPNCFPPRIRTSVFWPKTRRPAARREENLVAIDGLEPPTGSYPI